MNRFKIITAFVFFLVIGILYVASFSVMKLTDTRKITIVAFGDSLTEGYAVLPSDTYPAQLERLLKQDGFPNVTIYNKGYSGDTSYDGLKKVDEVTALKPDIVLLAFGANDARHLMPVELMKDNLNLIIDKLQDSGATVIFAGFKPSLNLAGGYGVTFEKAYEEIGKKKGVYFIPNLLENVAFRQDLIQKDMMHPNKEGYAIVAKRNVLPEVLTVLKKVPGK